MEFRFAGANLRHPFSIAQRIDAKNRGRRLQSTFGPVSSAVEAFEQHLLHSFPHTPTAGQERLIHAVSRFVMSEQPRCALIIRGYAGTGKTTSVGAIVRTLANYERPTILLAPTGRAAKVMERYAGIPASTIHRHIYVQTRSRDGMPATALAPNPFKHAVFIVDEASMIGESGGRSDEGGFSYRSLLDDLMEYVFNGVNCRLILVGDDAQLPPVGCDTSPALDENGLRSGFYLTIATIRLTDVVRQELDSGILFNAHRLRLQLEEGDTSFPKLQTGFPDFHRLDGYDLQEKLEELHGRYGEDGVVVITRSNKRANLFNQQIRVRVLWQEEDLNAGDRLMVVKNNYHWLAQATNLPNTLLANGDVVEVVRIARRFERYGQHFAEAEIRLVDLPEVPAFQVVIHLSVLNYEGASLPHAELQALFEAVAEDYVHLGNRSAIAKAVKQDPCYQALQVKFAWSLTCHKAQGGQWPAVIIDQGYLTEELLDVAFLRWLYTAFTRAERELYLLNFDDSFFPRV